jgi:hypothetical protein
MFRRGVLTLTAVFSLVAAGGLATAASAAAATSGSGDPVTITQHFHGVQTFPTVNPCNGNPAVGTATSNIVSHETFFPATGEDHQTFTEEDNFTVVGVPATFTGHMTIHDNLNLNRQNLNATSTVSAHATGSDGSTITFHEVDHFTFNADGTLTVSFERPSLTCG